MRVGINLLYLLPGIVGGTETHAAGLLSGLAAASQEDEFFVFLNAESADWPLPQAANFVRVVCPVQARRQPVRYAFEQLRLPRLLRRHRIEVVHSPGYVSPLRTPCPAVVTVHDLNFRAFGSQMPRGRRLALRLFVRLSVLRARRVLTVSEFSRRELLAAYPLPPERVVVTHNAPRGWSEPVAQGGGGDGAGARSQSRDPDIPYIVAFSSPTPNKNIPRLLEAFAQARERYRLPHRLVLVGHPPPTGVDDRANGRGAIRFTGYLDDADLQAVLAGAQLLAFPSYYEGFGLPVLEAMTLGVPVVCSDRAALPEVAGEAAVYFDPHSTEDMAHQLASVALDAQLRARLIASGYRNLRRFSWEETARRTLQVYREAIAA